MGLKHGGKYQKVRASNRKHKKSVIKENITAASNNTFNWIANGDMHMASKGENWMLNSDVNPSTSTKKGYYKRLF